MSQITDDDLRLLRVAVSKLDSWDADWDRRALLVQRIDDELFLRQWRAGPLAEIADKPPPVATDPKSRCCICNKQIMPTEPFTFSRPFYSLVDGTVAHADCYRAEKAKRK